MLYVDIPFSLDMKQAAKNYKKFCTSRNEKYGEPGDVFRLDEMEFLIVSVSKFPLWFVASRLYKLEGFDFEIDFIKKWIELHPKKGWEPRKKIWVHFFAPMAVK